MKQKYMLLKCMSLILVLSFSTITFGMNCDFLYSSVYTCKDHVCSPLLCPNNDSGGWDGGWEEKCKGLKFFLNKDGDTTEKLRFNNLFWIEHDKYQVARAHAFAKYICPKHNCEVLECPVSDCSSITTLFSPNKDDNFKRRSIKAIFWSKYRIRHGTVEEKQKKKKWKQIKQSYNQSGVDMNKRECKLGLVAAAATLLSGGIASGMETDDNKYLSVSTLNTMLAGEPFNLFSITEKDGKLKKTLDVNILNNPRFLPFTQLFAKHIMDMHTEYNLPTSVAFVKVLRPYVLNPNSASVYDANEIIKFWMRRHSSKKVLCGQTEFKDPRTGGRVDVNNVSFYRIELGEDISKNKNQSTTKCDKIPSKENKNSLNFEIDLDQLSLVQAGEEVGEDVKMDKLLKLCLMGTLTDLTEFSRLEKSESKNLTAWGNGQVISLFAKATARKNPSMKALATLGTLFKKLKPKVAIGFFQRLQDQVCVTKKKHCQYQIAQWEFMADFYERYADDTNSYMHKAMNVCKFVEKNSFAGTLNKTKAEEKLSKLQHEYDKSKNSDPASNFGTALMAMMKNAVGTDKSKDQQN